MHRIYKAYLHSARVVLAHYVGGGETEIIYVLREHYGDDDMREQVEVTLERAMDLLHKKGQEIISVWFHDGIQVAKGTHVATFVTFEKMDEITEM